MWSESSCVSVVNLAKKFTTIPCRDIEFFLGVTFLAHPSIGNFSLVEYANPVQYHRAIILEVYSGEMSQPRNPMRQSSNCSDGRM